MTQLQRALQQIKRFYTNTNTELNHKAAVVANFNHIVKYLCSPQ